MGDDALAWHVVGPLQAGAADGPDLELHMVEGGQRLLDLLDGQGTLLLIDAVESGQPPGTVHSFEWPDPRVESLRPGSTHHVRPAEALHLAETVGQLPTRVIVFGIEIEHCGPLEGLSPPVAAALPALVEQILTSISQHGCCRADAARRA
jgi:hydrogenase maturation protease